MSCPSKIPSYDDLSALLNRVNKLEQQLNQKSDRSALNVLGDNLSDLQTSVKNINLTNLSVKDELKALGNLGTFIPRTISEILNRQPAYASKSDIAQLNTRLSSVERFIEEYRRDKNSGLFVTKSDLEALRREAATRGYVDSRDKALQSALERLIDNAESEINGLSNAFRAEVAERKRITRQLGEAVEGAKNTANKALETAQNLYSKAVNYTDEKTRNLRNELSKRIESVSRSVNGRIDNLKGEVNGLRAKSFLLDKAIIALTATVAGLSATVAWLTGSGLAVFISTAVLEVMQTLGFQRQINILEKKIQTQEVRIFGVENLVRLKVNQINDLVNNLNTFDPTLINQKLAEIASKLSNAINIANQAKTEALAANAQSLKNALRIGVITGTVAALTAGLTGTIIGTITNRFPWLNNGVPRPVINNTYITNNYDQRRTAIDQRQVITNQYDQRQVINNAPIDYGRIDRLVDRRLNGVESVDYARIERINKKVAATTNSKVDIVIGSINGFVLPKLDMVFVRMQGITSAIATNFTKTWNFLKMDRVLNAYTAIVATHNAYMVSNALTQTLFSGISNALSLFGMKDANGQPIDVGAVIGGSFDSLMKSALGVSTWEGIKEDWMAFNRIYQAGANVLWAVQAIGDIGRSLTEIAIENTGKIGNALRKVGAVFENAYGPLMERANAQTATKRKIDSLSDTLQNFEEKASTLEAVTGNALELTYAVSDLKQSREEFDQTLNEQMVVIQEEDDAAKNVSKSPDIAETDLFKAPEEQV